MLFGPPGTAKTTTAESVAAALGYGFVVIDTAVFLEDGLANIASRMAYVFDRLERLRDCVILFDEIEEFCLDRTTPGLGMESRILTTAMLTRLNDLRRAERSIFLVATNRLAAFDSAVVRPGRLDMLLFVGTPNLAARAARFENSLPVADASVAATVFREFLEETWESDSRFLNFMESERFRAAALASMSESGALSADRHRAILGDVVRTSILRDESAREGVPGQRRAHAPVNNTSARWLSKNARQSPAASAKASGRARTLASAPASRSTYIQASASSPRSRTSRLL